MRIAVACDGLNVAAQASGCASFTCYAVNHGIISGCCNVPNMGITIFESVETLCQIDTDVLIAGSFDEDIRAALAAAGIEPAVTVLAAPKEAADAYLRDRPGRRLLLRRAPRRAGRRLRSHRVQARGPERLGRLGPTGPPPPTDSARKKGTLSGPFLVTQWKAT